MAKLKPPLNPDCADDVSQAKALTCYHMEHLTTYMRLLDAERDDADWTEGARTVLHIDPAREPTRARRAWETHLAHAKWITECRYLHLLRLDSN